MSTLYELDEAIRNFELEIDEETGEVLNAEDLDNLEMERETKIESVGLWVKNLEAEKEAVKAEKDRFAKREKVLGNKIEKLKGWLSYALQGEKFTTPRLVVSYRKSESVNITNELAIDDKYCDISVVRKPDKTALKKALKDGEEIVGAELVTKQNIQIN